VAEILKNIENNLKMQIELFEKLIELEKAKQQALVNNRIQVLEMVTAQEEKILLDVSRLEEERLYWADFFAQETGKKREDITLRDLETVHPVFKDIRAQLEKEIREIQFLKETNTKLLEHAIGLVNITINALTSTSKATYSPNNKGYKWNKENFFIDKDA